MEFWVKNRLNTNEDTKIFRRHLSKKMGRLINFHEMSTSSYDRVRKSKPTYVTPVQDAWV